MLFKWTARSSRVWMQTPLKRSHWRFRFEHFCPNARFDKQVHSGLHTFRFCATRATVRDMRVRQMHDFVRVKTVQVPKFAFGVPVPTFDFGRSDPAAGVQIPPGFNCENRSAALLYIVCNREVRASVGVLLAQHRVRSTLRSLFEIHDGRCLRRFGQCSRFHITFGGSVSIPIQVHDVSCHLALRQFGASAKVRERVHVGRFTRRFRASRVKFKLSSDSSCAAVWSSRFRFMFEVQVQVQVGRLMFGGSVIEVQVRVRGSSSGSGRSSSVIEVQVRVRGSSSGSGRSSSEFGHRGSGSCSGFKFRFGSFIFGVRSSRFRFVFGVQIQVRVVHLRSSVIEVQVHVLASVIDVQVQDGPVIRRFGQCSRFRMMTDDALGASVGVDDTMRRASSFKFACKFDRLRPRRSPAPGRVQMLLRAAGAADHSVIDRNRFRGRSGRDSRSR
jgi:hypothetical protein